MIAQAQSALPRLRWVRFDKAFLEDLPVTVDPCGENEEFHTFVYDGPILAHLLAVDVVQTVERDGFVIADLAWSNIIGRH
jgi:diphthamide synthase (EF-2-diphthine--ammonia ligase)